MQRLNCKTRGVAPLRSVPNGIRARVSPFLGKPAEILSKQDLKPVNVSERQSVKVQANGELNNYERSFFSLSRRFRAA